MSSIEPDYGGSDVEGPWKVAGRLVIARGDGPLICNPILNTSLTMNMELHPATKLLILLCLLMVLVVPLLAWFAIIRQNYDKAAKWWYSGLAVSGMGILLVVFLQRASAYSAWFILMAVIMCIHALKVDLGQRVSNRRIVAAAFAVFVAVTWSIELAGAWLTKGVFVHLFVLLLVEVYLLHLLFVVRRIWRSGGLLLAVAGLSAIMLVNAVRLVHAISQGAADPIFSLALLSNATIVGTTMAGVLMTLGYAIFTVEKSYQRHVKDKEELVRADEQARAAEEQARVADRHARELQSIIGQRDAMIMMNSRFSAVNSLAIYSSAIVHELSQPIQGVQTVVDKLSIKAELQAPALTADIRVVDKMVGQVASILMSLRRMIRDKTPSQELVLVDELLREIAPIMKSEASRRGIAFEHTCYNASGLLQVQVNRVLFERVLFNLVANALEALADAKVSSPCVRILAEPVQRQGRPIVVIRVEDNGPGFPAEVLGAERSLLITSKAGGSGIGLALASIIVESWRGSLQLSNLARQDNTGALVEISLPTL